MDVSKTQGASDFQVLEKHQPADDTDLRARVLFLTAGIGILCSRLLKEYMDHCDLAVVESGNHKVHAATTMEQYSATVKELLTVSIWLTLFEQADHELPAWFRDFMISCQTVADKVQPKPTSMEIDAKYNFNSPIAEICTEVAISLCMQLDLGATANDALIYLGDLLSGAKSARAELLEFALTQPVATLDQRIKQS